MSGPLGCSEGPRLWAVYPPRSLLFRRKEARPAFFRGGLSFSRPAVRKWPREGGHTLGAWLLWEHEGKALGIPTWQKSPVPSGLVGNELNARPRAPALPTPRVSHCGQLRPAAQGPLGQLRALESTVLKTSAVVPFHFCTGLTVRNTPKYKTCLLPSNSYYNRIFGATHSQIGRAHV